MINSSVVELLEAVKLAEKSNLRNKDQVVAILKKRITKIREQRILIRAKDLV